MKIDFSDARFNPRAFSDQSMHFLSPQASSELAALMEIIAIETGPRRAREKWQRAQLSNLLAFAVSRSAIWRGRIKVSKPADAKLRDLPVLTRRELSEQVRLEGSLLRPFDKMPVTEHSTSGSSGTPVRFFYSNMNGLYNMRRSHAQFLMEGRPLDCNFTSCKTLNYHELQSKALPPGGFEVTLSENWLGPLGHLFRSGHSKSIRFAGQRPQGLLKEISRHEIGYLVLSNRILETLFLKSDAGVLARTGTTMVLPLSGTVHPDVRKKITDHNIPVRGSYSCEEAGLIGSECPTCPEHYHVAGSNVIVEVGKSEVMHEGQGLGRVLITHLHSYATPFIRYDIGDFAKLTDTCPCGFDGPTISRIIGRSKDLLKQRDGSLTPFLPRAPDLLRLGDFPEYRIRQTGLDHLVVEIGGCPDLPPEVGAACEQLMKGLAGPSFQVDVRGVAEIDWGQSVKRPLFTNEII